MAQRIRTAKTLAQRIDLSYFTRPHPLRHWLLVVSAAVPAAALLWIAGTAAAGSRAPFSSGPLAAAHHVFADRCERCHVPETGRFAARVTDQACATCHAAPGHKTNQAFTPACASCHVDHRGPVRLAATSDASCTQCHGDLKTTDGAVTVATAVGAFAEDHPEFRARRTGADGGGDPAALRFNHAVHMTPDLRGPDGANVTLACATCHTPAEPAARAGRGDRRGGLMRPITYAQDCASCHALHFDPLVDAQAPHDTPELVRTFVDAELRRFITANPEQVGRAEPARGRIPENFPEPFPPTGARTVPEWIAARTSAVESYLWTRTCAECHTIRPGGPGGAGGAGSVPQIAPTAMTSSWMPHARFDHRTHQLATCASCHEGAATSTDTSEVLVPSISTCRQCHNDSRRSAVARCDVCHEYHDWTRPMPAPAGFEMQQLAR